MLDGTGRLWLTTRIRPPDNPDWCREGSDSTYAEYFPVERSFRQAGYYDPETEAFVLIDTCFGTHHLQFAEDANDTLYFSGGGQVIGWIDTKIYDETGDERFSQGWSTPTATGGSRSPGTNHPGSGARAPLFSIRRSTHALSSEPTASSPVRWTALSG